MKKLPIGIQTFSKLINENCVYIDKTALIYQLITEGSYYFLSRPRRFGKSLLISTLEDLFSGNRELFEGLAINSLPYTWEKHPVIMISFSDIAGNTPQELESGIKVYLQRIAQHYNLILDNDISMGQMLRDLVIALSTQNAVVLLIDEYDYSILKHIHNQEIASSIRDVLRGFYDVIKGLDQYLKFVLLTGVSQFTKTSIFSGLNNLEDISLSERYNTLLGYTRDEIALHFNEHLHAMSEKTEKSTEYLLSNITQWYDGYRFSKTPHATAMYNPFSVLLCLKNNEFSNYWFQSGTPTFLINLLKTKNYPIQELDNVKALEEELKQFDTDNLELKTLMFQTGYITIKHYDPESHIYTLGYPNKETINSLGILVIKSMTGASQAHFYNSTTMLLKAFNHHNLDQLSIILTQLFAEIPYTIQIEEEKYYQTIFYVLCKMIGADIIVEQPTNIGRIDAVLETKDCYFIIEFKINATVKKAMKQIEYKKYYQPYQLRGKKIMLVGIVFDTTIKNVSGVDYKVLE